MLCCNSRSFTLVAGLVRKGHVRPRGVAQTLHASKQLFSLCRVTVDSELDEHMLQRTAVARQGCRQGLRKEVFADIEAGKFVRGNEPYERRGKTISVSCRRVRIRAACARCQDAPQRRRRWLISQEHSARGWAARSRQSRCRLER